VFRVVAAPASCLYRLIAGCGNGTNAIRAAIAVSGAIDYWATAYVVSSVSPALVGFCAPSGG